MSKIKITADSTCDLSTELIEKYGIYIVPLYINIDDKSYKDGVDIFPDDIYKYVDENKKIPKTAAGTIADYSDCFKKWTDEGYDVIHINISSGFSCSYQNACLAAEDFENVYVINSLNLSTGSGHIVLDAATMAQKGMAAKDIADKLNATTPKVEASFVVDTLSFLHMGGRCSSVAALGANLLKLKPCIEVKDGAMSVGKKYRGNLLSCLSQYVTDRLSGRNDICTDRIFITHSGCDEATIAAVKEKVAELMAFDEVIITRAGCTISNHCGPNTLGILFKRK